MKTEILLEIETNGYIGGEDITDLTLKALFMDDLSYTVLPNAVELTDYWTIEESTKAKSISAFIYSLQLDNEFCAMLKAYNEGRGKNVSSIMLAKNYLLSRYGWESCFSTREMLEIFDSILEKHYNKIINGGNDDEQG